MVLRKKNHLLPQIIQLAEQCDDISVLWLYGSRASGDHHRTSDYDLAAAFTRFIRNAPLERRLRPELLAMEWQKALGLGNFELSIIDINRVPIPLAYSVISCGRVIFCRNPMRLGQEEQRILSRMELDIEFSRRGYG